MYTIIPRQLKRFSFQEDCLNLLRNVFEESAPGAATLLRPTQFPTVFIFKRYRAKFWQKPNLKIYLNKVPSSSLV